MRKLSAILLISIILTAVFVAGCTTTTTTPQPGTATPTQQATTAASASKEIKWQVNATHEGPGSMYGQIVFAGGEPAANVAVYIWHDDVDNEKVDPAVAMTRTDAKGNYEIKDIPNGWYQPRIPFPSGVGFSEPGLVKVDGPTKWDDSTQK